MFFSLVQFAAALDAELRAVWCKLKAMRAEDCVLLIEDRRLHRLTVGICVWAAVRIAVLEGLISEVGTGDSDHKTDNPEEKSAAEPHLL